MGALLNMTAEAAAMPRTRATVRAAYELVNARLAGTGIGEMAMPQGASDDRVAADIAELITAYEAIADRLHLSEDEPLDVSESAQARAAEALAAADGAVVAEDREHRAAKMQTRVLAGIAGACILVAIEVIAVLVVSR